MIPHIHEKFLPSQSSQYSMHTVGGGSRIVISTAVFHARARGSFPSLGGLKETKMFLPDPLVKQVLAEPP